MLVSSELIARFKHVRFKVTEILKRVIIYDSKDFVLLRFFIWKLYSFGIKKFKTANKDQFISMSKSVASRNHLHVVSLQSRPKTMTRKSS